MSLSSASRRDSFGKAIKTHSESQSKSIETRPMDLDEVLQMAHAGLQRLDNVQDYTCTLIRRERVGSKLHAEQTIYAKVRHEQGETASGLAGLSLYLRFDSPQTVKGREILFTTACDASRDELKLLVRNGGKRLAFLTAELPANSRLAMHGNRYPITEFGLRRLIERMIIFGEKEKQLSGGELRFTKHLELNGRPCDMVEVIHQSPSDGSDYYIARVLIDQELQLPIHFSSYTWPQASKVVKHEPSNQHNSDQSRLVATRQSKLQPAVSAAPSRMDQANVTNQAEPVLIESYTYRDLKINVDLSDQDFDRNNPDYKFSKRR